ncbi:MAG: bifunctional proline dehydrogenase/L-glutamate gamma-semialdehyde dehydrogenase [Legionellales bacterium]|nr:bifunctional proline dehydrogenase/L-glutamate gamma-semialdehyde dehydrogenase [Legionellales bacterium]
MTVSIDDTLSVAWDRIKALYRADETDCVKALLEQTVIDPGKTMEIHDRASELVEKVRKSRKDKGGIDAFMREYDLSSEEGIALMCMAEALLRIPDKEMADRLIKDKLSSADWENHFGKSDSTFVNAATFGLMMTGRVLRPERENAPAFEKTIKKLVTKTGEPVIREAVKQGMKILSKQFVMGRDIEEAIKRSASFEEKGYRYSYDMLGEAAFTEKDAQKYYAAYVKAIEAVQKNNKKNGPVESAGVSVKLSALHPRYEQAQEERVFNELYPRLKSLVEKAKTANVHLTVDAEESERLEISLKLIEKIVSDTNFAGWDGFGLAVQAYQKRAIAVIDWIVALAQKHQRRIMIRLVKGAYWDTEIKQAQIDGMPGYPVFTRKISTDVSYLACAKKLMAARAHVYPQFASHNAHTVASIMSMSGGDHSGFEFQCLHGMGQTLYDHIVPDNALKVPCRIYAPVGTHEELLAYLVRRLLENGANSSFVNRIDDENLPIEEVIGDPVAKLHRIESIPHPCIPLPKELYGAGRPNSLGIDLSDTDVTDPIFNRIQTAPVGHISAKAIVGEGVSCKIFNPAEPSQMIGTAYEASASSVAPSIEALKKGFSVWSHTPVSKRTELAVALGDAILAEQESFFHILCKEAGKILKDAIAEVREAADFCYYYAQQARQGLHPHVLVGPTGEENTLGYEGRGVMVCISPWNFPLAIYVGQMIAALIAGNTVLAKPAEQTPLVAQKVIDLMYSVGFTDQVVRLLPGRGEVVGPELIKHPAVKGVLFTGSTQTAKILQRGLADRSGEIIPLIAETGGQNAFIVDSSALPEQVTADVIESAFLSAGQRCSACRVLFVQEDVADKMIEMIKGAIDELTLDNPHFLSTDIGPVIDAEALSMLHAHAKKMDESYKLVAKAKDPTDDKGGYFFAPRAYEIPGIEILEQEVFGPILHIVRFKIQDLEKVLDDINNTGYGLTLGVHSRIRENIDYICNRARVGNIYINRNMVGAVVGVQPFGGDGLSGTGPKAGGPHYLFRLCAEKTISNNTAAAGGNASLMSLSD